MGIPPLVLIEDVCFFGRRVDDIFLPVVGSDEFDCAADQVGCVGHVVGGFVGWLNWRDLEDGDGL
jgi:hypothetical protein